MAEIRDSSNERARMAYETATSLLTSSQEWEVNTVTNQTNILLQEAQEIFNSEETANFYTGKLDHLNPVGKGDESVGATLGSIHSTLTEIAAKMKVFLGR